MPKHGCNTEYCFPTFLKPKCLANLNLILSILPNLFARQKLHANTHLQGTSLYFLHANHVEGQKLVQVRDSINNDLSEEVLLASNQLGAEGSGSAFLQQLPLFPGEQNGM